MIRTIKMHCSKIFLISSILVHLVFCEVLVADQDADVLGAAAPTTSHGHQNCEDSVQHCHEFPQSDCQQFYNFMLSHCPKYCGLCDVTHQPANTVVTDAPGTCRDLLTNCTSYPMDNCCGIYEPWARYHCASYCGFCATPPQRLCQDTVEYCSRSEPADLCTNDDYVVWRNKNCAGYCHVCDQPWVPPFCAQYLYAEYNNATQQPTPAIGDTTVNPCEDVLTNCSLIPPDSCCGPYEPWARAHCARTCGYCGVMPDRVCTDQVDYCERLFEVCTNSDYIAFKLKNCAGYCKLCDTPWRPPSCTAHLFELTTPKAGGNTTPLVG